MLQLLLRDRILVYELLIAVSSVRGGLRVPRVVEFAWSGCLMRAGHLIRSRTQRCPIVIAATEGGGIVEVC